MPWFLIIATAVYSALHAVVYLRLRPLLLSVALPWRVAGLALAILLLLAPVFSRLLFIAGHRGVAAVLAWLGYVWMGLLVVAFFASLTSWLVQGGALLLGRLGLGWTAPSSRSLAMATLLVALAASAYGLAEARWLQVEHLTLYTHKLPAGVKRVRIVQISDLHLGQMRGPAGLERVLKLVRAQEPDLVVSTGDLVDPELCRPQETAELLARLRPPLGKYAVIGNHEVYAGLDGSLRFLERCGFKVLRAQAVSPAGLLNLAGVDDPARGPRPAGQPREADLLASLDPGRYTVLLKHRPRLAPGALGGFDLQLSGHTHYGQIFPFRLLVQIAYPRIAGAYDLGGKGLIYTSRGTGTWGPPMRVLARPELTVIDILSGPGKGSGGLVQ